MALKVKVKSKSEEEEVDELENEEGEEVDGADVVEDDDDEATRLKIENAEMRGKLSVLQKAQGNPHSNHEQVKLQVFQDANNLSDEDFHKKYNMQKHMATASVLERENAMTKAETKQELAEARASSELSAKYGPEYFRHKEQIEETLADLSPEVRQDPKRLAKHMERVFKAVSTERPNAKPKSVKDGEDRRKVVKDFEKPTPDADARKGDEEEDKDEIEEQFRPLAKAVGIQTESERLHYKDLIDKGEFVPMELGGGVRFADPAKGFERVEAKK